MSFENKGFPNNLNRHYDNLRARALNYDETENFGPQDVINQYYFAQLLKKKSNQIDTESKGTVKGGGLSTKENPAEITPFVIEAKKKPKSKIKFFYYIIAIILIILIYKQFKK